MAATDSLPVPRKNVAYRVYFPIYDSDGDLVSGALGLDSERSIDGGAFADCTNEAVEIGTSGIYYLDLTNTEMNGDSVVVLVKTSTSGAKTAVITLAPEEAGDFRAAVTDKTGFSLSAAGIDAILDETIGDTTLTLRQAVRGMVAALIGKVSGGGTGTITFRNVGDTMNVIVATVDSNGNRSAVTFTP